MGAFYGSALAVQRDTVALIGNVGIGAHIESSTRFAAAPLTMDCTCDNPQCVNPDHLFLGTNADNMADRDLKGRRKVARGTQINTAKLAEEDVRKIKNMLSTHTNTEIARQYGLTPKAIAFIREGRNWRHI